MSFSYTLSVITAKEKKSNLLFAKLLVRLNKLGKRSYFAGYISTKISKGYELVDSEAKPAQNVIKLINLKYQIKT